MKKILLGLAVTVLLFGCGSGGESDTAVPESGNISADATAANVTLTDNLFITLSAKILCLPSNNAEASSDQIETLAKQILTDANVSAEDFAKYQKTIEADPTSKHELSLAIVGKMSEFCSIGATPAPAAQNATSAAETKTVDEISPTVGTKVENGTVGENTGVVTPLPSVPAE